MRNDNGTFDIIGLHHLSQMQSDSQIFTMVCLISYMMHFYNSTYPMHFVYECLRVNLLSMIAYTNAISKVQLGPTTILKYSFGLDVGYTEPVFFIYVYALI